VKRQAGVATSAVWRGGELGVIIAIPTTRNSVTVSIAQKAEKCQNGF